MSVEFNTVFFNGEWITPTDPSVQSKFRFNYSETANAGSAEPNPVMQWGYNLGPGGGPIVAGVPAIGLGLEGNYVPDTVRVEAHLYFVDTAGGQHRPWSFTMDMTTNVIDALYHCDIYHFFDGITDNVIFQLSGDAYQYYPIAGQVAGVPTHGFEMSADSGGMAISPLGSGSKTLNIGGWTGGVAFQTIFVYGNGTMSGINEAHGKSFQADNDTNCGHVRMDTGPTNFDHVSGSITFDTRFWGDRCVLGAYTQDNIFIISLRNSANIMIENLPTADPLYVGALWNNAGVLTVSAG